MLSRPGVTPARGVPFCKQFQWRYVHPHGPSLYPTSYVKDVELDHFDTCNNPAGMHLHRCICCTTLQFSNDEPKEHTNYAGSHLILPHGAGHPRAVEPPWPASTMREPYLMEMVGDFKIVDPIFKGCYGDSLLYSYADLCQLKWWGIYLPAFQG